MTTFLQLLFAGIALGSVYALVALGFTIVFRATRVINFAQGELLAFGAFFTSWLVLSAGLPFWLAFVLGAAATAAVGLAFQTFVLRYAIGRPDFTIVMLTLGLAAVLQAIIPTLFGSNPRSNGDPWGASSVHVAGLVLNWVQIWSIVAAVGVLVGFYWFNRTSYGLAMRAAASDQEAALAVGIPLRRVFALAWGLAGLVACVGGVFVSGFPSTLDPTVSNVALLAFPAIILGGID
jgi:branched-chain amino acid transport system permease protein